VEGMMKNILVYLYQEKERIFDFHQQNLFSYNQKKSIEYFSNKNKIVIKNNTQKIK
jgi:hypothetical protein